MSWFLLALGSAFSVATGDFLIKRYFSDRPTPEMVLVRWAGMLPMSLVILAVHPWPQVSPQFWPTIVLLLPAEVAATFLYLRAIQVSPLALTQPFLAFTPLFALLSGWLILGELPNGPGLVGVGLLAAGAYGLNLHQARQGWKGPLSAIAREPGSWMMLIVGAIYAYTAVMGRRAILAADPWFMAAIYPLAVGGTITLLLLVSGRLTWGWLRRPWPALGVCLAVTAHILCHMLAISQIQAAYMLSVKRTSLLFAMLYGGLLLGEERLGQHLLAGLLLVAGSAVILLWG
jgi:drug/metabolite transporter (DMT)-like permease